MAKYEKGRKCLVIQAGNREDLVGKEVILAVSWKPWEIENPLPGEQHWDFDPPIYDEHDNDVFFVALPEPWLLPIEDDDINKELRDELLEVKSTELVSA